MFLKKVLNQPNLVGSMLIALMVCGGFVYAVGFDGFNVETATDGEVEAWLEAAGGDGSGSAGLDPCACETSRTIADDCPPDVCKSEKDCGGDQASCSTSCAQATNSRGCGQCDSSHPDYYNCKNKGDLCDDPTKCTPKPPPPNPFDPDNDYGGDSGKKDD